MMKIETIVGDVVLLVLQEIESLKEMGIQKNKIYGAAWALFNIYWTGLVNWTWT